MEKILLFSFIFSSVALYAAEGPFGPIKETFSQMYWQNADPTDDDLLDIDQYSVSADTDEVDQASKIKYTPWYPLPAPNQVDEARFFNYLSQLAAHVPKEIERMAYICPFCRRFGTDSRRDRRAPQG